MLSQMWKSNPPRKHCEFDVQAHLRKEEFLRSQLEKEKKTNKEVLKRIEKQNKEIKIRARLVVTGLQERLHSLEEENQRIREDHNGYFADIQSAIERFLTQQNNEGKVTKANLEAKAEELISVSRQLSGIVYKRESPFKKSYELNRTPVKVAAKIQEDSPYDIPNKIFESLQNHSDHSSVQMQKPEQEKKTDVQIIPLEEKCSRNISSTFAGCKEVETDQNENCNAINKINPYHVEKNGQQCEIYSSENPQQIANIDLNRFHASSQLKTISSDETREKDEKIFYLESQLHSATSRILQLEEDLIKFKSNEYQLPSPLPPRSEPVIVSLDDLIDLKNYEAQIFTSCAMTLLFILVLTNYQQQCIDKKGERGENDFDISNIQIANAKSQRVIEMNDVSNFSVDVETQDCSPFSIQELSHPMKNFHENTYQDKDTIIANLRTECLALEETVEAQKKRLMMLQIATEIQNGSLQKAASREATLEAELEAFTRTFIAEKTDLVKAEQRISNLSEQVKQLTIQKDDMQRLLSEQFVEASNLKTELFAARSSLSEADFTKTNVPIKIDQFTNTEDIDSSAADVRNSEVSVLRSNLTSLKKCMKDRAVQSIEKIKTLQSEIDKLQHSNECVCKQLHVAEEKMFESQVELQEAKQQVRSFIEEKKKTKEYYRNQMKEYQKQYDSKCREIKKLQEMLISDKQRFKKLKESMKKIIQLKSNLFEDSLTTVNSLNESTFSICSRIEDDEGNDNNSHNKRSELSIPDPELHKLYIEEIQKRFESKDCIEIDELLSQITFIDQELRSNIKESAAISVDKEGSISIDIKQGNEELFDRLRGLQEALEKKHDECTIMQEEIILLKSKLHLYEVLNSNSASVVSSPISYGKFPLSPLLIDDEPMLHSDRKGEIRILRLKIIDLESAIMLLQQEKEALRTTATFSAQLDSTAAKQTSVYKQLQAELNLTLEMLTSSKKANFEWSQKYEAAMARIEELSQKELYYKNDMELERRNTLELLSELRHSPTLGMDAKIQDALGNENCQDLKKTIRKHLIRLLSADKMESIAESTNSVCTALHMLPQETILVQGIFNKLGPMIIAYSSFEDATLDISIAIDTLSHASDIALGHVQGFESY